MTGRTDGNGFYGGVDLAPGTYEVTVTPAGADPWTAACRADVAAGEVATLDLTIDRALPALSLLVDPSELWPPNHKEVTVTISGAASDAGTGIESVQFRVTDEYGRVEPEIAPVAGNGAATLKWKVGVCRTLSRHGKDVDGRVYTIEATVTDRACQKATATAQVLVPHDRGKGGKNGRERHRLEGMKAAAFLVPMAGILLRRRPACRRAPSPTRRRPAPRPRRRRRPAHTAG